MVAVSCHKVRNKSFTTKMAQTVSALKPYLDAVKSTLFAAVCLRNFPSQMVERHNKPEVEIRYLNDAHSKRKLNLVSLFMNSFLSFIYV